MSHLTQSFNTNAFDVNANQTASISTSEQFYIVRPITTQAIRVPSAGGQVRIGTGYQVNTISGLTVNTVVESGSTYAVSYTLATDGLYLFKCSLHFVYSSTTTGNQGYYLREGGSTKISNTDYRTKANIDYPQMGLLSTLVEVSGSSKTIDVYCISALGLATSGFGSTWNARTNYLTIQRLK